MFFCILLDWTSSFFSAGRQHKIYPQQLWLSQSTSVCTFLCVIRKEKLFRTARGWVEVCVGCPLAFSHHCSQNKQKRYRLLLETSRHGSPPPPFPFSPVFFNCTYRPDNVTTLDNACSAAVFSVYRSIYAVSFSFTDR